MAHPRSRGEHFGLPFEVSCEAGSSPLARGTRILHGGYVVRTGLIPARAGNTFLSLGFHKCAGAHPRSRGEHVLMSTYPDCVTGSSPLARGTRHRRHQSPNSSGLIPARAGNTAPVRFRGFPPRAHPRSRGEHIDLPPGQYTARGSSPLARGTPLLGIDNSEYFGLIPARAGNTPQCVRWLGS